MSLAYDTDVDITQNLAKDTIQIGRLGRVEEATAPGIKQKFFADAGGAVGIDPCGDGRQEIFVNPSPDTDGVDDDPGIRRLFGEEEGTFII